MLVQTNINMRARSSYVRGQCAYCQHWHDPEVFDAGAKTADLPVEQASRFELIINLTTAKASGLSLRQSLLLRAGELVE
jgi:hypothetical protein